jgi:hypothetical protein
MIKIIVHQQWYRLKHTYFDPFPMHMVMKTSPLKCMSTGQCYNLVDSWKNPKNMVCLFVNTKLLTCTWYYATCLTYILFFDVGDMSKEQRHQRQCSVPSNNWLAELRGLSGKSFKYIYNPLLPLCFFSLLWLSNTLVHGNDVFRETRIMIKNLMHLNCSKSATTARKRMATRLLYSWLL